MLYFAFMHNLQNNNKIALVTYTLNSGGVSVFIFNLAKFFSNKGYKVDIIVTNTKGIWFNKTDNELTKCIDKSFGFLQWLPFGNLINVFKLAIHFRKENYKAILINCSETAHLAIPFSSKSSKNISVIHNNKPGVIRIGLINKEYLHNVVCVSPAVEESVRKKKPNGNILTILNGVNIPNCNSFARLPIAECVKILFVGRLTHEQKGIYFIPGILKSLIAKKVNFHLTMVGDGPDKIQFLSMLSAMDIDDKISYFPLLENIEVFEKYMQHHIFLMPSFYEGLPLALMESMTVGCVPVTSRLTNSTDICVENDSDGILLNIGDEKSFAEKIAKLYLQPEYWNILSNNAINKAHSRFTSERMGNEYYELLNNQQMNLNHVPFWKPLLNLCSLINIIPPIVVQKYNEYKIKRHA
jgi:glycosyltransferase involved in cell wall biosynthesis